MKKARNYRIVAAFLIVIGAVFVFQAFLPIMPGYPMPRSQAKREIREYGRRITFVDYTGTAIPGLAAMIVGSGFIRKARRMDKPQT
jgi:hypothetical protein